MILKRPTPDIILCSESSASRCSCSFYFGLDGNGEVVIKGGDQCKRFPDCNFPMHFAMSLAQAEFDREAVTPHYALKEALPEP